MFDELLFVETSHVETCVQDYPADDDADDGTENVTSRNTSYNETPVTTSVTSVGCSELTDLHGPASTTTSGTVSTTGQCPTPMNALAATTDRSTEGIDTAARSVLLLSPEESEDSIYRVAPNNWHHWSVASPAWVRRPAARRARWTFDAKTAGCDSCFRQSITETINTLFPVVFKCVVTSVVFFQLLLLRHWHFTR